MVTINPRKGDAPDPFYGRVDPVRDAMVGLAAVGESLREGKNGLPEATSQGMAELNVEAGYAGIWGDEPLMTAYTTAGFLLFAAEDEMRSVARIFSGPHEPITVFGHMVVARGALEACARARWLLECSAGARGRVTRLLANRVRGLGERIRIEALVDPSAATRTRRERAELLERAQTRGFAHLGEGGRIVLDEQLPGYGTLVERLFEHSLFSDGHLPRVIYSYYSGIVHAETTGLLQSIATDLAVHSPILGTASVPVVTKDTGVVIAMAACCAGYIEAIDEQCRLMGWDVGPGWSTARLDAMHAITQVLPHD